MGRSQMLSKWRERSGRPWCFLCPLCHTQRRIPLKPRPGTFFHFFQIFLLSFFFMMLLWPWFHWKGIVCFIPFWSVFETMYRWKLRALLPCPQCGFDPYLFQIDIQWAKKEIEDHWKKKFSEKGIPFPEKPHTKRPDPSLEHRGKPL